MDQKDTSYYMSGITNSGGSASLDIDFQGPSVSKTEEEKVLAIELMKITQFMFDKGYIRFMSSSDLSRNYGRSRQYWEKLIKEGKIPYQKTASGSITTNVWVEGYLQEEKVEKYSKALLKIRNEIIKRHGRDTYIREMQLECPYCKNTTFDYNYNNGSSIQGLCRSPGCDFQIHTQA